MCALSCIERQHSIFYHPSSNGRPEAAEKAIVVALRKLLSERAGRWVHALPLAVWCLKDSTGLIAPYSRHGIVFGRDPVGFGDVPPFVPLDRTKDAIEFFQWLALEGK